MLPKTLTQVNHFNVFQNVSTCNNTLESNLTQVVFSNFTYCETKVADYLIASCYSKTSNSYCYETIASILNISRITVIRAVTKLTKLGIISRIYRHRKSCIITVNPALYRYAHQFRNAFHSLKVIANQKWQSLTNRNDTPYKNNISNNILYMKDTIWAGVQSGAKMTVKVLTRCFTSSSRRKEMEIGAIKLSHTLKEITKTLNLTLVGQLKLLSFEEVHLVAAWDKISYRLSTAKPDTGYNSLIAEILKIYKANDIRPDWEIFYLLLKRYNQTDNKRYFIPTITPKKSPLTFEMPVSAIPEFKLENLKAPADMSKVDYWYSLLCPDLQQEINPIRDKIYKIEIDKDDEKSSEKLGQSGMLIEMTQ